MSRLLPYLVAIVAVAVALGIRLLLNPWMGANRPFLLFVAAVAVAAWFGGTRVAIFSVVLAYVAANLFLIPPLGTLDFHPRSAIDWVNLLTFIFVSAFVIGPIAALRQSQATANAATAQVQLLLDKAERADRHKDQFLATLSHELRNPLASLSNALELLANAPHDGVALDRVRPLMVRQVGQMARLIDDLMDVSRIAEGRIRLQKDRVDLTALVGHAVEATQPLLADRGHQLHVELPSSPLMVEGDAVRLTQVLANLLHNAAKYTGRAGTIWITARRDRDHAVVRVRDNGPGIPGDQLTKVFDMFSQLDSTLHRAQGGLGIGLYLARQVIELHQGRIEARSEGEGKGAEFLVDLPCSGVAPEPSVATLNSAPSASSG
ncbi:MAG TPA: HAMP domain-containing sensor histidine kinase [Pirellulales bacterium]|jgi:signal transduction histidine kinase|nr:HAMP domain-containing sensor histidine kinase [Pirellulales bacterium]